MYRRYRKDAKIWLEGMLGLMLGPKSTINVLTRDTKCSGVKVMRWGEAGMRLLEGENCASNATWEVAYQALT